MEMSFVRCGRERVLAIVIADGLLRPVAMAAELERVAPALAEPVRVVRSTNRQVGNRVGGTRRRRVKKNEFIPMSDWYKPRSWKDWRDTQYR